MKITIPTRVKSMHMHSNIPRDNFNYNKIIYGARLHLSVYKYFAYIEFFRISLNIERDERLGLSSITYSSLFDEDVYIKCTD